MDLIIKNFSSQQGHEVRKNKRDIPSFFKKKYKIQMKTVRQFSASLSTINRTTSIFRSDTFTILKVNLPITTVSYVLGKR